MAALPSTDTAAVINRLRRAQGQLGGVIRLIEEGRDCSEVVTQLAAAARALDRAGFTILSCSMEQSLQNGPDGVSDEDRKQMEKLFLTLA